jgi:aryl-alcohol dehydrogenase-like predicted oxidoreductase
MAGYRAVSMNVRRIPLRRTGLRVSEMVFGAGPIGGLYAPVSDDQAAAALEAAWAAGIRAFDTAPHNSASASTAPAPLSALPR